MFAMTTGRNLVLSRLKSALPPSPVRAFQEGIWLIAGGSLLRIRRPAAKRPAADPQKPDRKNGQEV